MINSSLYLTLAAQKDIQDGPKSKPLSGIIIKSY